MLPDVTVSHTRCPHPEFGWRVSKTPRLSSAGGGAGDSADGAAQHGHSACNPPTPSRGGGRARGGRTGPRGPHTRPGPSFTQRVANPDVCARASPSGHLSRYAPSPSSEPRPPCAGSQPRDHGRKTRSPAGPSRASCRTPRPRQR